MTNERLAEIESVLANDKFEVVGPIGCSKCRYARLATDPESVNWADPDEAMYHCDLIGPEETKKRTGEPTMWGEWPGCGKDWTALVKGMFTELVAEVRRLKETAP